MEVGIGEIAAVGACVVTDQLLLGVKKLLGVNGNKISDLEQFVLGESGNRSVHNLLLPVHAACINKSVVEVDVFQ